MLMNFHKDDMIIFWAIIYQCIRNTLSKFLELSIFYRRIVDKTKELDMKILSYVLSCSILGFAPNATIQADEHGGVHIHLHSGEDIEDNKYDGMVPNVCWEQKPWYHHQHFDEYEDIELQADRLQENTAWPGQREEFSDQLLR